MAQIVTLRFTPKQIRSEPVEVIDTIRGTLEGARGRPPLNLRTVPSSDASLLNHTILWTSYSAERRAYGESVAEDLMTKDFTAEPGFRTITREMRV